MPLVANAEAPIKVPNYTISSARHLVSVLFPCVCQASSGVYHPLFYLTEAILCIDVNHQNLLQWGLEMDSSKKIYIFTGNVSYNLITYDLTNSQLVQI